MRPKISLILLFLLLADSFLWSELARSDEGKIAKPTGVSDAAFVEDSDGISLALITDLHGQVNPLPLPAANGEVLEWGGAEYLSSYIQILRRRARYPLLLIDGGDAYQGTMESDMFEGEPVLLLQKHMGVRAMPVGNHEFDYGPIGPSPVSLNGEDSLGALKRLANKAIQTEGGSEAIHYLASNILEQDGSTPSWLKKSVILNVGDFRVGIVGATSIESSEYTVKENIRSLQFGKTIDENARRILDEAEWLRKSGVDFLILALHAGSECDDNSPESQRDLSTCKERSEAFQLLGKLPPDLFQVVTLGHTHKLVSKFLGNTAVIEPAARGQYLIWVDIPKNGALEIHGPIRICGRHLQYGDQTGCSDELLQNPDAVTVPATFLGEEVRPDMEVTKLLRPYRQKANEVAQRRLGVKLVGTLDGKWNQVTTGSLFMAHMFFEASQDWNVDLALINDAAVRSSISDRDLNYGDIYQFSPFDNVITLIEITGVQLKKAMSLGLSGEFDGLTWFGVDDPWFSDPSAVKIRGQEIGDDRVYRVVTSNFLATGGSGFDRIGLEPNQIKRYTDTRLRDAIISGLKAVKLDVIRADDYRPGTSVRTFREQLMSRSNPAVRCSSLFM